MHKLIFGATLVAIPVGAIAQDGKWGYYEPGDGTMQAGIAAPSAWSRDRYALGLSPTSSVKRELNEPSEVQPTAKQTSVTDRSPRRSRALARSIRRVMR